MLTDRMIEERMSLTSDCRDHLRISPFQRTSINTDESGNPIVSYGLSSAGYDFRVQPEWLIKKPNHHIIVDPLTVAFYQNSPESDVNKPFVELNSNSIVLDPHGFALVKTVEWFRVPEDCVGIVFTKSTWARCGICLNTTPLEPGWEGYITIEVANLLPSQVRVYAYHGIGQVVFMTSEEFSMLSYNKKPNASYQNQKSCLPPCRVDPTTCRK